MERIVCSAVYYMNDIVYPHQPKNIEKGIVVCGLRHSNCFVPLSNIFPKRDKTDDIQGFLTSKNRFVHREEAGRIAFAAGQTDTLIKSLHSEDLY
jgi:hypothetical protein